LEKSSVWDMGTAEVKIRAAILKALSANASIPSPAGPKDSD
jgi:hypothetical protein